MANEDKIQKIINSEGTLEKAKLYTLKAGLEKDKEFPVQFNPSEYSISRSMTLSETKSLAKDQDIEDLQVATSNFATLSLTLFFDQILFLSGTEQAEAGKGTEPADMVENIISVFRYNDDQHVPLKVRFIWGSLDFIGYVAQHTINYTMFGPDGKPVRIRIQLSITGEETSLLQKSMQRTFNSPDRTKERLLLETDHIWMLANEEYDDPALWKVIAEANGILNPRKINKTTRLKLPAIK